MKKLKNLFLNTIYKTILISFAAYYIDKADHQIRKGGSAKKYFKKAIFCYSCILAINTLDEKSLFDRALCYTQTGELTKALNDLSIFVRHHDNTDAFVVRADIYCIQGEKILALWNVRKALQRDPRHVHAQKLLKILKQK